MARSRGMNTSLDSTWIPEFLAIFGSILSLTGVAILLAIFDNKKIFHFYGVTLNSLVSLLSTVSKGWLMLVLAEAISQWKWILFSSRRRLLIDFNTIDIASRGPLGSFWLLWRTKGMWVPLDRPTDWRRLNFSEHSCALVLWQQFSPLDLIHLSSSSYNSNPVWNTKTTPTQQSHELNDIQKGTNLHNIVCGRSSQDPHRLANYV